MLMLMLMLMLRLLLRLALIRKRPVLSVLTVIWPIVVGLDKEKAGFEG
jgi:hypothetical protein